MLKRLIFGFMMVISNTSNVMAVNVDDIKLDDIGSIFTQSQTHDDPSRSEGQTILKDNSHSRIKKKIRFAEPIADYKIIKSRQQERLEQKFSHYILQEDMMLSLSAQQEFKKSFIYYIFKKDVSYWCKSDVPQDPFRFQLNIKSNLAKSNFQFEFDNKLFFCFMTRYYSHTLINLCAPIQDDQIKIKCIPYQQRKPGTSNVTIYFTRGQQEYSIADALLYWKAISYNSGTARS